MKKESKVTGYVWYHKIKQHPLLEDLRLFPLVTMAVPQTLQTWSHANPSGHMHGSVG